MTYDPAKDDPIKLAHAKIREEVDLCATNLLRIVMHNDGIDKGRARYFIHKLGYRDVIFSLALMKLIDTDWVILSGGRISVWPPGHPPSNEIIHGGG